METGFLQENSCIAIYQIGRRLSPFGFGIEKEIEIEREREREREREIEDADLASFFISFSSRLSVEILSLSGTPPPS
jgi:hypothetical protein